MPRNFDIFISFKDKDTVTGQPTRDSQLARECHDFLSTKGFNVFCSIVTLETLGTSAYREAINDALDQARVLIAVGTSADNLNSRWPRYEWDGFTQDILDGIKPHGQIFLYLDAMDPRSLPRPLRQWQAIMHGPGGLEQLHRFVANRLAIEKPEAGCSTPGTSAPRPGPDDSSSDRDTDDLTRQAIKLLGSGDHRGAVSLLTQEVKRCQATKNFPGQATALIELARIVSGLPGQLESALKLARNAQVIASKNSLRELEREGAAIVASIRRKLGSDQRTTLTAWIGGIVEDDMSPSVRFPDQIIDIPAIDGAWEWVMEGNVSVAVDFYARTIGGRLWVPYSYGSTGECSSIHYGFKRAEDAWFSRFSWKDSEISGFSFWKIESSDVVNGEWWYDSQAEELPVVRPPSKRGHATRMERIPVKPFPLWAETVFTEIERRYTQ